MKTIEEAAKEHIDTPHQLLTRSFNSFKAGVEFAQRWIPVEEELPEANFMEAGMQFGLQLLIKLPNNRVVVGSRRWSNDHDAYVWRYDDGGRIFNVTHWRPIEVK